MQKIYSSSSTYPFWMKHAFRQARQAKGWVSPNPSVGAVIVKEDTLLGFGCTQPPGQDHAEIVALKMAGEQANGATLYSTLEPCCHYGRTPPCTIAITQKGIRRVVVGSIDPNSLVFGAGIQYLRDQGIEVITGVADSQLNYFYRDYFYWMLHQVPYVTAKYAMSWDGRIATDQGDSRWISSLPSRKKAHWLRHTHDAVLVGVNTIIQDDPQLTVRLMVGKQPLRIVLDPKGRIPASAKVLNDSHPTLLVTKQSEAYLRSKLMLAPNVAVLTDTSTENQINWNGLLKELGKRSITSLFIEGGSKTLGFALQSKIIQEVVVFIGAKLMGGIHPASAFEAVLASTMDQCFSLKFIHRRFLGEDVFLSGIVDYENSSKPKQST